MTEPRSPDEEPIIELTEVVERSATGDDDIIELTDVVESPSTADEGIIELTDVVDSVPDTNEDIIELTEVVASRPMADEDIIELTEIVSPPQAEEEVIDLLDVVDATPEAAAAVPGESEVAAPAVDAFVETEPEQAVTPAEDLRQENVTAPEATVFDLFDESTFNEADAAAPLDADLDFAPMDLDIEENKAEDLFDSLGMKLEPDLQSGESHDELDFNLSTQELSDAIDLLDAKLAEDPPTVTPASIGKTEALSSTVSDAQLEKALENVIRKMFAEKIDLLLNEAIEKNVTAEIERLKEQLLTDSPED